MFVVKGLESRQMNAPDEILLGEPALDLRRDVRSATPCLKAEHSASC